MKTFSPQLRRRVLKAVRASLKARGLSPSLVNDVVVDHYMRLPSLVDDWEDSEKFESCVKDAVTLLLRTVSRRKLVEPARPVSAPNWYLGPRHGVVYALMLDLPEIVLDRLQACRRHFWKAEWPPFSWDQHGSQTALEKASEWLDQRSDGAPEVENHLVVRLGHVPSARLRQ